VSSVCRAIAALIFVVASAPARPELTYEESDFLSRVHRVTYDGRRAGEGYFSADGAMMVFQSERLPENPFFQIYLMDLRTGDTERVSTGMGKTTCAFIRPGTQAVMFSSTHHDPRSNELQQAELDLRASGQERRYAWDYDPEMEIWEKDMESAALTRLTHARGYDAEGSYSPDGQWIVFASNRDAYTTELTPREQKRLELDPSFFLDLYVMDAEGGNVRRLTDVPGYDGGPFFFPDGSRIVWRRFDEDGLLADIWSMAIDGTDQRRITAFGAMSWAPYVHPSGKYIFFASNRHGFENVELFIVDVNGVKEPVRVTYTDGFDGLPVPTPDGTRLSWTSTRHGGDGGQIYFADWNHEAALNALGSSPPRVLHDR
jgi:Tol biopolymer transport system component